MKPIKLSFQQQLDVQLALDTGCFDGLDADAAAYVSYAFTKGSKVPVDKLLARTCGASRCVNPNHLVLIDRLDPDHKNN